jgi:hypothetical protein
MKRNRTTSPLAVCSRLLLSALVTGVALTQLPTPAAHAADETFIADYTIDGADWKPGDGKCDAMAMILGDQCTLRAAVMEASALTGPQTIQLVKGTYKLTNQGPHENGGTLGDIDIHGDLIIKGVTASETIIDGQGLDRVLHVHSGVTRVNNVTLTNGNPQNDNGGAIMVKGGSVKLYSSVVSNSKANQGGGIYSEATAVHLLGSKVQNNTATLNGGGVVVVNASSLDAVESVISGNQNLTSSDTTGLGGGIYASGAQYVQLERSLLASNKAARNGGAISVDGPLVVVNSTISTNTAGNKGGGIFRKGTGGSINNTTFTLNKAVSGGGMHIEGGASVDLRNSLLANNTATSGAAPDCTSGIVWKGFNLIKNTKNCNGAGGDATNITGKDPKLAALQTAGTAVAIHALLADSPALDKGDNGANGPTTCATEDQLGTPRPVDGNGDGKAVCDIGAHERK